MVSLCRVFNRGKTIVDCKTNSFFGYLIYCRCSQAVVDDREDVWANAKDNSERTIKGEPPDNLLLVRPYHWQQFVGFADINNAAGVDFSGYGLGSGPDPNNESDNQLLWTKRILEDLHQRYYRQSSDGNRTTVPETLKKMRREVLMGSKIVLSGLVPLHKQSTSFLTARPPCLRYAQNLGAEVRKTSTCYVCIVVNYTRIYCLTICRLYCLC